MTNKEILGFDGNEKINQNEYKILQKLANGKEDLSSFKREDLIKLKNVLQKQLQEYEARQNVSESSKKWIAKLTNMAIDYVDKVLTTKPETSTKPVETNKVETKKVVSETTHMEVQAHKPETSTKPVETNKVEAKKVVSETTHMEVQTHKPENSEKRENTEAKNSLLAKEAENKFNERLKEYLDPKNTIVFDLDGNVVTLKFDNPQEKNQAEEMFKKLEKTFGDDKLAVYSVLSFMRKYKDNIQTVEEIYKKAGEGLYGNQIVVAEDKKSLALLDAAKNKNVKVIEVDTGNKFFNALLNTITFNLFDIDTANVSAETLEDGEYGRKATSKDLFYGYYRIEKNLGKDVDVVYTNYKDSADIMDTIVSLQEPLKHFTKEKLISEFADKIEDYLRNPNEKVDPLIKKLAEEYLKANGINPQSLKAVDLKPEFRQDEAIKKWLKENKIIDKMATKDDVIEITKDGFFHINHPEELFSKDFVKVKLDDVDGKDKEVLMKVSKATYKELFGKNADIIAEKLANMPPIVLKDGSILAYTKGGIVALGDKIGNGVDAIRDFLEQHKLAATSLASGIIGALIAKGVDLHIDLSGLGDALKKLGKPFENLAKALKEGGTDLLKAFRNTDVTKLEAFGLGYLLTALPLNYKIEALEEKYAKLYGNDRGAQAVKAEIDAIVGNPLMVKDEELKYDEAQGLFGHYVLVKTGLFKPGEATGMDTKVEKSGDKYKVILDNITEDSKIILAGKELYLDDGDKLEIEVKKDENDNCEVQGIYGKLDVTGKDDFIKFTGDKATYYKAHVNGKTDKKKTVSIENKSMDEIIKELTR